MKSKNMTKVTNIGKYVFDSVVNLKDEVLQALENKAVKSNVFCLLDGEGVHILDQDTW